MNALTLLAVRGTAADLRRHRHLLPHVEAAAGARLELRPNYWELASMLEVAANKRSQAECIFHLRLLLAAPHEPWQLKTTANNLLLLRDAPSAGFRRARRWLEPLADALAHGRYEPAAHTP